MIHEVVFNGSIESYMIHYYCYNRKNDYNLIMLVITMKKYLKCFLQ